MADAMSDYLEDLTLDHTLGVAEYTYSAGGRYIALFGTTSSLALLEAGTLTGEISGNAYARTAVTFVASSGGATDNNADVTFPSASGGNWGIVRYAAVMDASTGGNVLYYGQLLADKDVSDGDTFKFNLGAFDITIA